MCASTSGAIDVARDRTLTRARRLPRVRRPRRNDVPTNVGARSNVTKQELIDRVYKKRGAQNGLTKKAVADVIDGVFAELGDYFIKARVKPRNGATAKFTYPGFGTFAKRRRPEREGRHPQTGAPIRIPSIDTVSFAVGSDLRSLLNRK